MKEISEFFLNIMPGVESWLRGVVKDEVQKALAEDEAKKRPPKTYTRKDVANMAHITLPTLWKKVNEGKITPMPRTGRRVLFSEEEVQRFLKR